MKTCAFDRVLSILTFLCLITLVSQAQFLIGVLPIGDSAMNVNIAGTRPSAGETGLLLPVTIAGTAGEVPVAVQNQKNSDAIRAPLEVHIVGAAMELPVEIKNFKELELPKTPIDVNISALGNVPVPRSSNQPVLPVRVENVVATDIVAPNFTGPSGRRTVLTSSWD